MDFDFKEPIEHPIYVSPFLREGRLAISLMEVLEEMRQEGKLGQPEILAVQQQVEQLLRDPLCPFYQIPDEVDLAGEVVSYQVLGPFTRILIRGALKIRTAYLRQVHILAYFMAAA